MRSVEPGESWAWCFVDQQQFDSSEPAPLESLTTMTPEPAPGRPFLDALYLQFLARGLAYFFPGHELHDTGAAPRVDSSLRCEDSGNADVAFSWLGRRFRLAGGALSSDESNLVRSIGRVLELRYHLLQNTALAAQSLQMFSGLAEDRYVSSYLDPSTFADVQTAVTTADRITSVIEVLRVSGLSTYENRPIHTGVLLFGSMVDPCHTPPNRPPGAIQYSAALTGTRSFHRLCDGLSTLALVDSDGMLAELIDVREWSQPYSNLELPVPAIERYRAHCRATLCGGHVCLVLTPNGEVKIFANGAQAFSFLDGRWKLTEAARKYKLWLSEIGDAAIAERLFTAALELAEARRGALFVVLEDRRSARQLIPARDLVSADDQAEASVEPRRRFQYLLRGKRLLEIAPAVLVSVARIDGAMVIDAGGDLLAFGTILRGAPATDASAPVAEGGRMTAALGASRFGSVLMVSEDGLVSFFRDGRAVWQM
jgi:DNA integrity scanning protein DisA with diadenylate cyclase activity